METTDDSGVRRSASPSTSHDPSSAASKEAVFAGLLQRLADAYHDCLEENSSLRKQNMALTKGLAGPDDVPRRGDKSPCKHVVPASPSFHRDQPPSEPTAVTDVENVLSHVSLGVKSMSDVRNTQNPMVHTLATPWTNTAVLALQMGIAGQISVDSFEPKRAVTRVELHDGWCSTLISYPGSTWRFSWDLLGLLFIIYDLIIIPLRPFDPPESILIRAMELISVCYWTLNVVFSFFVGYVERGTTIMQPRKIIKRYLETWFVLDVLVLIPDWFITWQSFLVEEGTEPGSESAMRLLRVLRLVKCMRLLRIAKLKQTIQQLTDRIDSEYTGTTVNIVKMFIILLFVNHFIASLWYAVGTADETTSWVRENKYDKDNADFMTRYLVSFQWSITQFTPASKVPVHPTNLKERSYAIFVVVFALIGFAYLLGSISNSIGRLRAMAEDADRQFFEVRRFLRQNEVSPALGARILRFLEHAYAKANSKQDGSSIRIFSLLSDSLRNELRVESSLPLIKIHPLFLKLSYAFKQTLTRLASCLKRRNLASEEVLFFEAERATHICFLEMGSLKYLKSSSGDGVAEVVERREAWITEQALWAVSWLHVGRSMAIVESEVHMLSPQDFADMVALTPAAFSMIKDYAHGFISWLNADLAQSRSDVFWRHAQSPVLQQLLHSSDQSEQTSSRQLGMSACVASWAVGLRGR